VSPIVATALTLTLDTYAISTKAKIDSINISNTIGMESIKIAFLILPVVKSVSLPVKAMIKYLYNLPKVSLLASGMSRELCYMKKINTVNNQKSTK
jgi:hypothetical protein